MQLENIVRYTQLKIGKKILSQIFLDIVNTLKYCEIEFLLWSRRLPLRNTYLLQLLYFLIPNSFLKFDLEIFIIFYLFKLALHLTYSICYIINIFFFLFSLVKIKYFTIFINGSLNIMMSH